MLFLHPLSFDSGVCRGDGYACQFYLIISRAKLHKDLENIRSVETKYSIGQSKSQNEDKQQGY